MKKLRALLLAAGFGTRLKPLTNNLPKCLVEISGKPLLGRWIKQLEIFEQLQAQPLFKYSLMANGTILSLLSFRYLIAKIKRRKNMYVPSMIGIPYFGSVFAMIFYGNPKWNQTILPSYGPICSHSIGTLEFITINDINLVKEIFANTLSYNRPKMYLDTQKTLNMIPNLSFSNMQDFWFLRR